MASALEFHLHWHINTTETVERCNYLPDLQKTWKKKRSELQASVPDINRLQDSGESDCSAACRTYQDEPPGLWTTTWLHYWEKCKHKFIRGIEHLEWGLDAQHTRWCHLPRLCEGIRHRTTSASSETSRKFWNKGQGFSLDNGIPRWLATEGIYLYMENNQTDAVN